MTENELKTFFEKLFWKWKEDIHSNHHFCYNKTLWNLKKIDSSLILNVHFDKDNYVINV